MTDARSANFSHEGAAASMHGTTIICIRKDGVTAMAGDGQVSLGSSVVKNGAKKVRRLKGGGILAGFAGATADAFTLLERLETKLEKHPSQLARACVELAKDWRSDKYLRQLQAMLIVADPSVLLLISGSGDVVEPDDGVLAVGSGGLYALASARTLLTHAPHMDAEAVALAAMETAADLCVFTNRSFTVETLRPAEPAV